MPYPAGKQRFSLILALVLIISVVSTIYWGMYALNAYNTFHEYLDLGAYAYNMWFYLHYPSIVSGVQFLIFGNHIAPDQLLMLPFFYAYQSSLTLLFAQAIVLTATGIVIFLVARDLLGNEKLAFILFIAFVLNPGMHGMMIFDYHVESFIIIFYVLTFYFYMKRRTLPFLISLLLLLGTIEEAPFLAATLGVGLILFEFFTNKDPELRKKRIKLAVIMITISAIVAVSYYAIEYQLGQSYMLGDYAGLPVELRSFGYTGSQIGIIGSLFSGTSNSFLSSSPKIILIISYGIVVALFAFGFAALFEPIITLILVLPWLIGGLVTFNWGLFAIYENYFGFVLGGVFVGAILGIMAAGERKSLVARLIFIFIRRHNYKKTLMHFIYASTVSMMIILLAVSPIFVLNKNVNNLQQDFLFQVNASEQIQIQQLNYVIGLVPSNAALMTTYFVMPHVIQRKNLELLENSTYFFKPEYVLIDFNENISLNALTYENFSYFNKTINNSTGYSLVASNGTARLYKLDNR